MQAASAHTSDAHFILLANGYQLDVATKHAVVSQYIVGLGAVHRTQFISCSSIFSATLKSDASLRTSEPDVDPCDRTCATSRHELVSAEQSST